MRWDSDFIVVVSNYLSNGDYLHFNFDVTLKLIIIFAGEVKTVKLIACFITLDTFCFHCIACFYVSFIPYRTVPAFKSFYLLYFKSFALKADKWIFIGLWSMSSRFSFCFWLFFLAN